MSIFRALDLGPHDACREGKAMLIDLPMAPSQRLLTLLYEIQAARQSCRSWPIGAERAVQEKLGLLAQYLERGIACQVNRGKLGMYGPRANESKSSFVAIGALSFVGRDRGRRLTDLEPPMLRSEASLRTDTWKSSRTEGQKL